MADTIFGSGTGQWVCPNDRQLALRAKLQTGWSVHTFQTEKQRKMQALSPQELEVILEVIRKAEKLDITEQQRIGRLVERLENMRKNVMGNGLSQCLLCGELLGLLGTTSVFCQDCKKKVCTKCGIETCGAQKRPLWLCKICSEQREVWKRSGAWFYKGLPKYITPLKSSSKPSELHSQPWQSEPAVPEAESVGTSRSFTWARGKGWWSDSANRGGSLLEVRDGCGDEFWCRPPETRPQTINRIGSQAQTLLASPYIFLCILKIAASPYILVATLCYSCACLFQKTPPLVLATSSATCTQPVDKFLLL
uniref:Rab effector Noc2 n=1 Tax=Athene cunicularia TaxID=194338 RepID=A0A663MCR8_ATHCN